MRFGRQRHTSASWWCGGFAAGRAWARCIGRLSKDAGSAHGLAPSLWIYDELAQSKTRELLDNLINGMGKRDDALGIVISTQAPTDDHHLSQLIDEGLSGQNPNTLVMLDAAPEDADPYDPAVWRACNQALGKFLNEKEFAIAAERARTNPALEASFLNLRLNQRVSPSPDCLITASQWKGLAGASAKLEDYAGRECIGGLDLSQTTDLSALVLVFPTDKSSTATFDIVPFFWTPMDKLKQRSRAGARAVRGVDPPRLHDGDPRADRPL